MLNNFMLCQIYESQFQFIISVNIQMHLSSSPLDKENRHPNRRVIEEDISKIGKQYVVDGQRVRAKSIIYRQYANGRPMPQNIAENHEALTQNDIAKLQYLQKMGYLNEEEKFVLQTMHRMRGGSKSEIRQPLSNIPLRQPPIKIPQNYCQYQQPGYPYPVKQMPNIYTQSPSKSQPTPYPNQMYPPYYSEGQQLEEYCPEEEKYENGQYYY